MKRTRSLWETAVKSSISIVALFLIFLHLWVPALKVDVVTVALLVVAVLPWAYTVIQSVTLPGGYGVKFQDIAAAGAKLENSEAVVSLSASASNETQQPILERVQSLDPNLAVAGLRIEIEKSIRKIADAHGIPSHGPLTTLLGTLGAEGLLAATMVDGLRTLIRIGNEAVHGATVDPEAAEWAILHSQQIIRSLSRVVEARSS